jgi:hypothetical protein
MADPKEREELAKEDADLGGPYARDAHRGGLGDDYARDSDPDAVVVNEEDPEVHIGKASE